MPRIITASERITRQGIKGQIWGPAGVGKTSSLKTIEDPDTLLVVNIEAGLLAIGDYPVQSIEPADGEAWSWTMLKDIACWIGGPNPNLAPTADYSQAHYTRAMEMFGGPEVRGAFRRFFIDSTTNAAGHCFRWSQTQPEAFTKDGKADIRGAYGLLGREIVAWANHLQHAPNVDIWLVGGLEQTEDEYGKARWTAMIDGSKGASALPYIFDEVFTMVNHPFKQEDGTVQKVRTLFTQQGNIEGYPAKDRSGQLDYYEAPDLGAISRKIRRETA
jgi:hypothetical protein